MNNMQYSFEDTLFHSTEKGHSFPSTRYQGSKQRFVEWIWYHLKNIPFNTMLDAFGGTGCVAYRCKEQGKAVSYNDILPFNSIIGRALIENDDVVLDEDEINWLMLPHNEIEYPHFIEETFKDIYYTDEENRWLDRTITNITQLENQYKQALAYFALFQPCIIKRPYNLFHRKNLYVRTQDVKRSFGNKVTWDTPFEKHFRIFSTEANRAVFKGKQKCYSLNKDAMEIGGVFDLIYIDTPYISEKGVGVDYADFYHLLNGMVCYEQWNSMIDFESKHKRLRRIYNIWNDKVNIKKGFESLIEKYSLSILVFSYRSNGLPSVEDLLRMMRMRGRETLIFYSTSMKYVLSNQKSQEVLIISYPPSYSKT